MATSDHHIGKKRKINGQDFHGVVSYTREEEDNELLNLSLSIKPSSPPPPPPPPPALAIQDYRNFSSVPIFNPPEPLWPEDGRNSTMSIQAYRNFSSSAILDIPEPSAAKLPEPSGSENRNPQPQRVRRKPSQLPKAGKSLEIPPPFRWAKNLRASVRTVGDILSDNIHTITGEVQCKRCERAYEMGFDLRQKSLDVWHFITRTKSQMYDRAPTVWMNPIFPSCRYCEQENSTKPVISDKKKTINWLFLYLGQMLGCCTLAQLKYFCKHTKNHRTGAKDRVLYLTYMELCKQLGPVVPFK